MIYRQYSPSYYQPVMPVILRVILIIAIILLASWIFMPLVVSKVNAVSNSRVTKENISTADILAAEQKLSELGYWTGSVDGVMDEGSRHALIAFQKVELRRRTGKLTSEELQLIRKAHSPTPTEKDYQHIEVDLLRQVLFFVDRDNSVSKILPISSGSEKFYEQDGSYYRAHTPRGKFTILRKINGWRRSPLGLLYYPNYLYRGIAIHGNPSVPTYPASHGCIRIPMFAAKEFSELAPIGTVVMIHDQPTIIRD
jgi:lipoprotein-anchoring transpeptidase ErfK/SrfK